MKKVLKLSAAAAVALSAITPVAAFAAETEATQVKPGIYTTDATKGFTSIDEFKKLSLKEKAALLQVKDAVLVLGTEVIPASVILTGTNDDLANSRVSVEKYQEDNNVILDSEVGIKPTTPGEVTEVKVSSVSAINKSGVTVKFPALTEAQTDVEVTVKDDKGNTVEVKPVSVLDVGETTATFTFKTALTSEPAGTWTVDGVSFDANAQAAVKAINTAANQVELNSALKSTYFTDVDGSKITDYFTEMNGNTYETIADVQKAIDKVNKASVSGQLISDIVDAMADNNEVTLLTLLGDASFERVNDDFITQYMAEFKGNVNTATTITGSSSVANVQAEIDAVNKKAAQDAVTAADTTPATALTADAINKAQDLVTALPENTDGEKADKKGLQDKIDVANAFAKVKGATTQASLLSALKSPVLKLQNIDDALAKFYKLELDKPTGKDAITSVSYTLQTTIVNAGKTSAIADLGKKISEVTAETSTTDLKALLSELKRLDGTVFIENITDALLEDYRAKLVATTLATAKDQTSEITALIAQVNNPATAISAVTSAANATDLLDALKAKTLNLNNVKDANKDAYYDAPVNKSDVSYFTKVTTPAEAQKVVNATNAFVDANTAASATELNSALNSFVAIISDSFFDVNEASNYINLSSAAKFEVAEIVLNAKDADYADAMELAVAINDAVTAYTGFLGGVNSAASISAMNTALDNAAFPAFQELSPAEKVAKAEAVYNKLTELKAQDPATDFKTIAQIKTAAGL